MVLLDLTLASSFNPAFITANAGTVASAEAALAAALNAEESYLNIHTSEFPTGEIRGFLVPVPEPSAILSSMLLIIPVGFQGVRLLRKQTTASVRQATID